VRSAGGYSVLEVLFVTTLIVTVSGVTVPRLLAVADESRAAGAARYVSGRLQRARMEAILRSADVAIRFSATPSYGFATFVDGNGNGVLAADIARGIDRPIGSTERLPDNFRDVDFAVTPGLPPVDAGGTPPGTDPIRLGAGDAATFTARGTSSSGSVYIRGPRSSQYVVRIYGDTGKTRVLKFDRRTNQWRPL